MRPADSLDDLDYRLIARLVAGDTGMDAAAACGCDVATLHRRKRNPAFIAAWEFQRADASRLAGVIAREATVKAVRVVAAMLDGPTNTPAEKKVVIQAAEYVRDTGYMADADADAVVNRAILADQLAAAEGAGSPTGEGGGE